MDERLLPAGPTTSDAENPQTAIVEDWSYINWAKRSPCDRSLWPTLDDGRRATFNRSTLSLALETYMLRWKGNGEKRPQFSSCYKSLLAFIGSYISLVLISQLHQRINTSLSLPLLLSTFGPSCALVFGFPTLPTSQPLNGLVGSLVAGGTGLFFRVLVARKVAIVMPLAVAAALAFQEITGLQYPSGITTTVLLVTLVPENTFRHTNSHDAAHTWCIRPMLEEGMQLRLIDGSRMLAASIIGQAIILLVALIVNNLDPQTGYPSRWL